jgi:hypothetical protein
MYGLPLYNPQVVVPSMFFLLMIIHDILGYILCKENLMCSELLFSLKPLLKIFSLPQSNKSKLIMVAYFQPVLKISNYTRDIP